MAVDAETEPERVKEVEHHLKEESRLYPLKHAIDGLLPSSSSPSPSSSISSSSPI